MRKEGERKQTLIKKNLLIGPVSLISGLTCCILGFSYSFGPIIPCTDLEKGFLYEFGPTASINIQPTNQKQRTLLQLIRAPLKIIIYNNSLKKENISMMHNFLIADSD